MKRAALYARVSSDFQKKEGTIASQVSELKKQITAARDTLVKEYVDEGYSGALLDRPALNELRSDLKDDVFDAIYFLNTDRMARDVTYQTIIIGELLRHERQIIINGQDYVHNPENKFTLTVLGAVAELERAKITERMARGKLHRLRQGYMLANGSIVYGYDYIPRDKDRAPSLVVNEPEASVVRDLFETYAKGDTGIARLTRRLEEAGLPTKRKSLRWTPGMVKYMLKNETYAGTKHFNAWKYVQNEVTGKTKKIQRDPSDWIAVNVPPIISRPLFEKVQARMASNASAYRSPKQKQLLSQLMVCGECGLRCYSYQRYYKHKRLDGTKSIHHKVAYRCNRRELQRHHARSYTRCANPEISARLIEPFTWNIIESVMLDPTRLRLYMDIAAGKARVSEQRIRRQVTILDRELRGIEQEKRRVVDIYAAGHLGRENYITKNRALDVEAETAQAKRAQLLGRIALLATPQVIDASIAQFCHLARARFDQARDFESKRWFLLDYIDKITYHHDNVTLHGSVSVLGKLTNETKLEFKIERPIDRSELLRLIRQIAARTSPSTAVRRALFPDRSTQALGLAA